MIYQSRSYLSAHATVKHKIKIFIIECIILNMNIIIKNMQFYSCNKLGAIFFSTITGPKHRGKEASLLCSKGVC